MWERAVPYDFIVLTDFWMFDFGCDNGLREAVITRDHFCFWALFLLKCYTYLINCSKHCQHKTLMFLCKPVYNFFPLVRTEKIVRKLQKVWTNKIHKNAYSYWLFGYVAVVYKQVSKNKTYINN